MSIVESINKHLEAHVEYGDYLSEKENWTPMLKMIARDFLLAGFVLGCLLGAWVMFWLR